jgi:hypothetical protein
LENRNLRWPRDCRQQITSTTLPGAISRLSPIELAPSPLEPKERPTTRTMRHHIRGWITQWDMLRLYGRRASVDVEAMRAGYEERDDLAEPTEE